MKKSIGFIRLISSLLIISLLGAPVLAQSVPSATEPEVMVDTSMHGCFSMDAKEAFLGDRQIIKNAQSVFMYELSTETLMYAWDADKPLVPSSFVKILTAIIAIENADLTSAVTVQESAVGNLPSGAVSAKLVASEVMTLQDLLYCMMVGSANDAATVIAQYVAGSESAFAAMMNDYASKIGCTGSNFVNPHGLQDERQYMTARDTAKILGYAMENDVFKTLFSTKEYSVAPTNKSSERYLITGNYMMSTSEMQLYYDDRVIGGRTGVANDGTRSLVTIAKDGPMELLCVVMGSASVYEEGGNKIRSYGSYTETKTMLDSGFYGYSAGQILYDGQALTQFDVANGDSILAVCPRANVSSVLPSKLDRSDLSFRYSDECRHLTAPIYEGDRICTVEIWYRNLCIAATDLYAMNNVRDTSVVMIERVKQSSLVGWIIVPCMLVGLAWCVFYFTRSPKGRRIYHKFRRMTKRLTRRKRSS